MRGYKNGLGVTREKIYEAIVEYTMENLCSPSLVDISTYTGTDPSNISFHLGKLEEEGKIIRINSSRGIKLVGYKMVKDE